MSRGKKKHILISVGCLSLLNAGNAAAVLEDMTLPGVACEYSSDVTIIDGAVWNKTNSWQKVTCPVPRDDATRTSMTAWVYTYDGSRTESISCTWINTSSDHQSRKEFTQTNGNVDVTGWRSIGASLVPYSVGYTVVECNLPPGGISAATHSRLFGVRGKVR